MAEGSIGITEVENREHISPNKTGDNISAKRVVPYYWDGTNWQRQGAGLVPSSYDYMAYTNTNSTTDTYVYKTGGAGGTTVATVTIVYTDTTKATVSTVTRA